MSNILNESYDFCTSRSVDVRYMLVGTDSPRMHRHFAV